MDKEDRNKSLIKKTDAIAKYDPQKKKKLILRGLDELENIKLIDTQEGSIIKSCEDALKTEQDINNAQKRWIGRIESRKEALKLNPNDVEAYFKLGLEYFTGAWAYGLDMYKEAIEAYKAAIRINPDYIYAYNGLGDTYRALNMYQEAVAIYKQALRIKSDDADIYSEIQSKLGFEYVKLGMAEDAIEAFKHAIRINPYNPESNYLLCIAYDYIAMFKDAIGAYKQTILISPNHVNAHYELGLSYLHIGQKNKALEEYQILKKLDSELAEKLFEEIYK